MDDIEALLADQRRVVKDWNWWSSFLQREYYASPQEMRGWETTSRAIARDLNISPGDSVMDLGSGCGEVVLRLALRGAHAVGVERSGELVAYCRRTAAERGVVAEFAAADMFEYEPTAKFDAILSLNTSFGYGSDEQNRDLIRKIGRWLKPGGRFHFDLFTADNAEPFGEWNDDLAGGRLIVDNSYDQPTRTMTSHPAWIAPDNETVYYADRPERIMLYERNDLEEMMRDAGMIPRRLNRAMGRRFAQTDDQMYTTWIATRSEE